MENLIQPIVSFLVGSVAGVMLKNWFDYKLMIYEELWKKRFDSYKQVFQISSALPLYPEPIVLNWEELREVSEKMRDWYFEGGGMLLSNESRNSYFDVQKSIKTVLKTSNSNPLLSDQEYEAVRDKFSTLRTEFSNDLMSRKRVRMLEPLIKKSGK